MNSLYFANAFTLCVMLLETANSNIFTLQGTPIIDESFIVSEAALAFIPNNKFNIDSWYIQDDFMIYCTDVFTASIANLVKRKCLDIEEHPSYVKIFGFKIYTKISYTIRLVKRAPDKILLGWLEEKIFKSFITNSCIFLDEMVQEIFDDILEGNKNLANPGKAFTLALLREQRMHQFEFNYKYNRWSYIVSLWRRTEPMYVIKNWLSVTDFNDLRYFEEKKINRIIKIQLRKFQNLD